MKNITAFAPATIANFNVGYDILGLSLSQIGDEVSVSFNGDTENRIVRIINGDQLPLDINKNCCSVVIRKIQESLKEYKGVDIIIKKGFASGSGLGSSSASSAAAAYAFNHLLDTPYTTKELIPFAAEGERIACGSAHIDNVAPSLLGGIVLAIGKNPSEIIELPMIDNLYAITLFPNINVQTSEARKILKDSIPLSLMSQQVAYMGAFISSLYENDLTLFSASLKDLIIEPMRSLVIPRFYEMKKTAIQNKALAFGISGSGPSVFAITEGLKSAKKIEIALASIYDEININIQTFINPLRKDSGARILK